MSKIFKPALPTVGGMHKKKHAKKHAKKSTKKHTMTKKRAPFMWRMVIINGMVKKMKVNRKKRGGFCPLTMSNDPNQFLLLQPEVKNVQAQSPTMTNGGKKNKRGGGCGCNSGKNNNSNNLATQASMGGMKKKRMSMSEYKEKLQKKNVEKLKKLARSKGLKVVKKDGTALKKSSIIRKLCDCRSKK